MVFKQIFRVAFVTLIWKQYKHVIISTLLLFGFLYLIGSLHADFLQHAQINGDKTNTGISFIYKWSAFAGGLLIYFAYHYFRPRKKNDEKTKQQKLEKELAELSDDEDPFAAIRARDKLRGRADFIMEDKEKR